MRRPAAVVAAAVFAAILPARADLFKVESFSAYADARVRAESDFDSRAASGAEREDRTRMRVRFRTGFVYTPTEAVRVEMRIRSGQEDSQQSPHITILDFDDNDTGETSFDLDRWYVQGKFRGLEAWAGRNDLPFWKQDELLFDDDVTMPGVALRWSKEVGPGKLSLAGGYFAPPVGMRRLSGNMGAVQIAYQPKVGSAQLAFAAGTYRFESLASDPDAAGLLEGNGARDYSILAAGVQAKWSAGKRPLVVGADFMHNDEDYDPSDPDPVTAANFDQTDGYVLLATYGGVGERNDWLVGYYYAHIETFAVNSSYAQDDWVRWGSATQTRGSNMEGHELRFGWGLSGKANLIARLYLVEAITTVEDGSRFRIDLNYKF